MSLYRQRHKPFLQLRDLCRSLAMIQITLAHYPFSETCKQNQCQSTRNCTEVIPCSQSRRNQFVRRGKVALMQSHRRKCKQRGSGHSQRHHHKNADRNQENARCCAGCHRKFDFYVFLSRENNNQHCKRHTKCEYLGVPPSQRRKA